MQCKPKLKKLQRKQGEAEMKGTHQDQESVGKKREEVQGGRCGGGVGAPNVCEQGVERGCGEAKAELCCWNLTQFWII